MPGWASVVSLSLSPRVCLSLSSFPRARAVLSRCLSFVAVIVAVLLDPFLQVVSSLKPELADRSSTSRHLSVPSFSKLALQLGTVYLAAFL